MTDIQIAYEIFINERLSSTKYHGPSVTSTYANINISIDSLVSLRVAIPGRRVIVSARSNVILTIVRWETNNTFAARTLVCTHVRRSCTSTRQYVILTIMPRDYFYTLFDNFNANLNGKRGKCACDRKKKNCKLNIHDLLLIYEQREKKCFLKNNKRTNNIIL